jgi:large subunit ribosomal protein L30
MSVKIKITQKRSSIRCLQKQKKTLTALGLRGIGKSVIQENNPVIAGMVQIVSHLVSIEDAQ